MSEFVFRIAVAVLLTASIVMLFFVVGNTPGGSMAFKELGRALGVKLVIGIVMSIYFAPAIVAGFRSHHNTAAILILNLFLGWTGLGWIASLVWSATAVAKA